MHQPRKRTIIQKQVGRQADRGDVHQNNHAGYVFADRDPEQIGEANLYRKGINSEAEQPEKQKSVESREEDHSLVEIVIEEAAE